MSREKVQLALDMLAMALADHGHVWTREERGAYDRACEELRDVHPIVGEYGTLIPCTFEPPKAG